MSDGPPRKVRRKVPPSLRKERDDARLRKMKSNGSDKASRKAAPRIEADANRRIRRGAAAIEEDTGAAEAQSALKLRRRHWGSYNVADERSWQHEVRAWLDAVTVGFDGPRDRRRWAEKQMRRRKARHD